MQTIDRSPPLVSPSLAARLRCIRHVALDMDGTIYKGKTLFQFTNSFLARLTSLGISYSFLTNNSSKSVADYVTHLRKMGVSASASDLYTSTQATLAFLKAELPRVRRVFSLGTASMNDEVAANGFALTADNASDEPDAVIVGFDTALTYARLCRAAYWVKRGKPFIATHPDLICPTDDPTVLVDCGAVCAALEKAAGRGPDAVLGKPDPRMLHGLCTRLGLEPQQLAMVGDRLYTDIAMAHRAGALGVLVLTGEATADDAAKFNPAPDLVVASIAELGEQLEIARRSAS